AVAEILAFCGYDFLLIDNEHGPGDPLAVADQLRAIQVTETVGIVRVPWNDHVTIKKYLDVGVEAVMVPMIQSAEEAKAAVAACKYPPVGIRGIAHTDARASNYGLRGLEYLRTANENIFVILQIESVQGVENADAIAAVEGVDMILIGPFDLSASQGHPAEFDRRDHKEAMARVSEAVKRAGKYLGTTPYGGRSLNELYDQGFDLIIGKPDVSMLRDAALEQVRMKQMLT
ncbi:HpcH/HpaI aldolase family protein, partial [Shumkonia mesophila]|uniref:HpcH/HpaI aldolase family protein n=1 Tax=Shumkonia mesophila TaxID=2838854 RepID=UPI002934A02F